MQRYTGSFATGLQSGLTVGRGAFFTYIYRSILAKLWYFGKTYADIYDAYYFNGHWKTIKFQIQPIKSTEQRYSKKTIYEKEYHQHISLAPTLTYGTMQAAAQKMNVTVHGDTTILQIQNPKRYLILPSDAIGQVGAVAVMAIGVVYLFTYIRNVQH